MIDIEQLRQRVLEHKDYRHISESTGYAYDSLTKFAYGYVKEPAISKILLLVDYFSKIDDKAA